MLDNMTLEQIQEAVDWIRRQRGGERVPKIEVSGNITLENVRQAAMAGVDDISVGSLTHSSTALDMSLRITRLPEPGGKE
jgi:nicotinate-nucleotide pyrophosphorylase (carboxylating)